MGPYDRFCYVFEYVLQIDFEDFLDNTGLKCDDLLEIKITEDPRVELPDWVVHRIVKTYPFICYNWLKYGRCRIPGETTAPIRLYGRGGLRRSAP